MSELKFMHIRRYDPRNPEEPLLKGGVTLGYKLNKKGTKLKISAARCSNQDYYNKSIGRDLVVDRMDGGHYQEFKMIPELPPGAVAEMLLKHGVVELGSQSSFEIIEI